MSELLSLVCSMGFLVLLGHVVLRDISGARRMPLFVHLGLVFGLGAGMLTLWMLILGMIGIPLRWVYITLPFVGYLALRIPRYIYGFCQKPDTAVGQRVEPRGSRWGFYQLFLVIFICFFFIDTVWRNLWIPVYVFDGFSIHAFKAKIVYFDRHLQNASRYPHPGYPLHLPFLMSWIAMVLNHWTDQWIKGIYPFFVVSQMALLYGGIKAWLSDRALALSAVALLLLSNVYYGHAALTIADMPLAYYNTAAVLLLILWNKDPAQKPYLLLGGLFSGLASWTKLEGAGFLFIHMVVAAYLVFARKQTGRREKSRDMMMFMAPALAILLLYLFFKAGMGFQPWLGAADAPDSVTVHTKNLFDITFNLSDVRQRLPVVLRLIVIDFFVFNNWHYAWLVFFACLVFVKKRLLTKAQKGPLLAVGLYVLFYFLGWLVSSRFVYLEQHTLVSRCFLHFMPLVICATLAMLPNTCVLCFLRQEVILRLPKNRQFRATVFRLCSAGLCLSVMFVCLMGWCIFGIRHVAGPSNLWQDVQALYEPVVNFAPVARIGGVPLWPVLLFVAGVMMAIMKIVMERVVVRAPSARLKLKTNMMLALIFVLGGLGGIKILFYELTVLKRIVRKRVPAENFYNRSFNREDPFYQLMLLAKDALPPDTSVVYHSGYAIDESPGMYLHRAAAYFLYPIDMRNIRGEPPAGMVIYAHPRSVALVPSDHSILGRVSPNSLVAVKTDREKVNRRNENKSE